MVRQTALFCLMLLVTAAATAGAQNQLDSRPLDPSIDPDIDLFINNWKNSRPYNTHGNLTERAILTRWDGDPVKPEAVGQVLVYMNNFAYGTLPAGEATSPTTLEGEQEVFYFSAGSGVMKARFKEYEVERGVFVIAPAGLEFTIENTGDGPLCMYIIREPVPNGFRPNTDLVVRDSKQLPLRDQGFLQVHWAHNGKNVFTTEDGLGELERVNLITFDPMTIGQPHSHGPGVEESWTVVEGRNLEWLGKELRWMDAGTGFLIPPTGFTPHSHINSSEEPLVFLYWARFSDHDTRE